VSRSIFLGQPAVDGNWSYSGTTAITSTIPTLWNRVKNTISTVATNTVVAGKWARGVALSTLIATQSGVATSYNKTKNFVANTTATIVTSISGFFGFTPVTTGVGVSLKYNRINLRIGIGF
jgi:hypothetical protein